jgi:acetyl esterase
VTLWDAEVEALRPVIKAESAEFVAMASYGSPDGDGDHASRDYEATRQLMISIEVRSDLAVDRVIAGPGGPMRLRTFSPPGGQARAVFLHLHGGGWSIGRPEMGDLANEALATKHDIAVVSVDYRLAPEHPFPAAPDDCEAAALWLAENAKSMFGSDVLLIGGESAGAHLAAVTLLRMRDKHNLADRFAGANLEYGYYDFGHLPSHRGLNGGPDIIDSNGLEAMAELVLPGLSIEQRRDPAYSPLWADLEGLPPALFAVGLADHLSDDTLLLASRWERAGNHTELLAYPDAPHGCLAVVASVRGHYTPRRYAFFDHCLGGAAR